MRLPCHNYSASLKLLSNGSTSNVQAARPDGKYFYFKSLAGVWRPDADINDRLTRLSDAAGTLTGWQYTVAADDTVETYDAAGHLLNIRHRGGLTETLSYSDGSAAGGLVAGTSTPLPAGLLIRVTDNFGRTLAFTYDAAQRIVSLSDPDQRLYQYSYDANNNLVSVHYPDGTTRQYLYNEPDQTAGAALPHALTGIIDENGSRYATFKYDSQSRAIYSGHAAGALAFSFAYNPDGTTVTDPLGTTRNFSFQNILGTLKKSALDQPCTLPGCTGNDNRNLSYDANGNLTARTDFNGTSTTYTHDSTRNLPLSRTEAAGTQLARTTTTTWHSSYRLPNRIEAPLSITDFVYDADGHLLSKTETARDTGTSRIWSWTYNAYGQVLSTDGPRTDVEDRTSYTYDSAGNLATVTNALGQVLTLGPYDASGRLLKSVDANGKTTTFTYSPRGWLLSRTVDGWQTQFSYDAVGQLVQYTPPTGKAVRYGYDAAHRLTSITNSANQSLVYELDAAGNVVRENRLGSTANLLSYEQRQFDALGRLAHVLGNHGQVSSFSYDAQGNPTASADALGRQTQTAYDVLGRIAQITDAAGGQTHFSYDADDRLTQVTDPIGLSTRYLYDGLGQLQQRISPDTGTSQFAYDPAGNLIRALDARGIETRYTYDALNRPTSRRYPADPGRDVTLAYDQNSNGKGHLTQLTDESGTTRFTYHRRGLLIGQDSNGLNVGYGYNASDNLSSIRYPSGRLVQYVRGGPNEAIGQINLNVQGTVTPLVSGIGYRGDGPRAAWTYGNGLKLQRSYDTDTRLVKQTLSTRQGLAWSYNSVDQLTVWTDLLDSARTQRFSYDALDRLSQASGPYATQGFSYDANGNRLREQSGNSVTTYAYAPGSQRLSSRSGSVNEARSYDAAGHPASVRGLPTTYSVSGRLAQAGSTEYRYNGFGQRVYKNVGGVITRYVYDPAGNLLAEVDASGRTTREYVWLDEQPIAVLTPTTPGAATVRIDYIVPDHLGTPRLIIDSAGAVVWRWDSDPFGSTAPNEDPAGTGTRYVLNLRFPGQYFDAETGFSYNYFRTYEPGTGRYLESDPIGLDGGLNIYAYVGENPLSRIDPFGLYQMCHRDLQLPIPYARHCYARFDDGSTSSFDPNGVNPDPDQNQSGTTCTNPKEPAKDSCIKKAMQHCKGSNYNFTAFNCCHCVEQALKDCGTAIPPSSWPNWPINPGPQPSEPGYRPSPVYGPELGK